MRRWVACALALAACGGTTVDVTGTPAPGAEQTCTPNPYGACYPTDDIGSDILALEDGGVAHRGERIAPLRFVGYRATNADAIVDTSHLQTISLADFYDPEQRLGPNGQGMRLLHVFVNAEWCGPSNEESDFISGANWTGANTGMLSFAHELEPRGVVFFEVLMDGPTDGVAPTPADLLAWVTRHDVDYTLTFDVDGWRGSLFKDWGTDAIPLNLDIDPRSMEILSAGPGFDTALDQTLSTWLDWVSTHPAL